MENIDITRCLRKKKARLKQCQKDYQKEYQKNHYKAKKSLMNFLLASFYLENLYLLYPYMILFLILCIYHLK